MGPIALRKTRHRKMENGPTLAPTPSGEFKKKKKKSGKIHPTPRACSQDLTPWRPAWLGPLILVDSKGVHGLCPTKTGSNLSPDIVSQGVFGVGLREPVKLKQKA